MNQRQAVQDRNLQQKVRRMVGWLLSNTWRSTRRKMLERQRKSWILKFQSGRHIWLL
jgi:hypothetical protein